MNQISLQLTFLLIISFFLMGVSFVMGTSFRSMLKARLTQAYWFISDNSFLDLAFKLLIAFKLLKHSKIHRMCRLDIAVRICLHVGYVPVLCLFFTVQHTILKMIVTFILPCLKFCVFIFFTWFGFYLFLKLLR